MAGNTLSTPVAQQPQTTQGDPNAVGIGGSWLIDSQITINKEEFGPDAVAASRDILAASVASQDTAANLVSGGIRESGDLARDLIGASVAGAGDLAAKGLDLTLQLAKVQAESNKGLGESLASGLRELNAGADANKADTSRIKVIVIGLVLVVAAVAFSLASLFKSRKS